MRIQNLWKEVKIYTYFVSTGTVDLVAKYRCATIIVYEAIASSISWVKRFVVAANRLAAIAANTMSAMAIVSMVDGVVWTMESQFANASIPVEPDAKLPLTWLKFVLCTA